jgi:hypothetical protein
VRNGRNSETNLPGVGWQQLEASKSEKESKNKNFLFSKDGVSLVDRDNSTNP